jgi:vacuolar-type H+-ATPase subunit E/Vma4
MYTSIVLLVNRTRYPTLEGSTMSSPAVIPDLPVEFLQSDNPVVQMFLGVGLAAHSGLVEAAGQFETVREAENRAATALAESTDPVAVAYREAKEAADAAIEQIKAERDAQPDAIRKLFAEKTKNVSDQVKAKERETLSAIQADAVSEINVTELVENYTTKLAGLKILASNLKDQCPELSAWFKSLPSRTAQANGSGAVKTVDSWTPRLVSAVITDQDGNTQVPEPTTLGAIAKLVGGSRKGHQQSLLGAIGSPDNLSVDPESPSVYSVTNNGKVFTVAVVGRDSKSDD